MSAIKNHYHAEINADPSPDDSDWDAPGSGYFEFVNRDEPYVEPELDPEFDRFEGESEHALRAVVLDLLGIGWSPARVTAVVAAVAKDAA